MNNILRANQPLTVLLFCFTGGSAGGLLAKPTELIVVPMATALGLVSEVFCFKLFPKTGDVSVVGWIYTSIIVSS